MGASLWRTPSRDMMRHEGLMPGVMFAVRGVMTATAVVEGLGTLVGLG